MNGWSLSTVFKKRTQRIIFTLYSIVILGLFFYSFTQVDLNLTLIRWPLAEAFIHFFQQIGYFNRSFSTTFYLVIVSLLFGFYIFFLTMAHKKRITKKEVWMAIAIISIVLTISYNAFSYDLFNYVFDAKIITYYNQNPYEHSALNFPHDPMLSFMHWTHRTFPYGPVWLLVTVPLSYIGLQYFLPTIILFKILMVCSYLGTVYAIERILRKTNPGLELFGVVFFALNPLVLIEALVSAHNDIVMMFFVVFSLLFLIERKYLLSVLLFIASVGIKFVTIFALPFLAIIWFQQRRKKRINWEVIFSVLPLAMVLPIFLATIRTNFQPWYLLYALPFAALVAKKYYILIPSVTISAGALLEYAFFFSTGNWDPPIPTILFWVMVSSILLSLLITLSYSARIMLVRRIKNDKMKSYEMGAKV